jgi:leucyl aminopeptidase
MPVNIKFSEKVDRQNYENFVVFFDNKTNYIDKNNLLKEHDILVINKFLKKNKNFIKKFSSYNVNSNQKVIFIKTKDLSIENNSEKLGADFFDYLNNNSIYKVFFFKENIETIFHKKNFFINEFIHGIKLKSYKFEKYISKKSRTNIEINLIKVNKNKFIQESKRFNSILEGVNLTKDLVSEPGNILHPDEYVNRIKKLKSFGLKVTIYNKAKLKKLGMNALLGVGQGSIRGSYLATIEWKGLNKNQQPLAFVGKGVCFDTGGISLKPAKFMEDMTYDMAGSAVVVGLMKTLALRKAKINAVGVVGLVENMPDGNAQRPGDIVKSYSGKTIEILNTDAEGRLVLADALTYTEKKYKPEFIIDLATLTGAIIVSLGSEYAGLFSNDDKISDQLSKAGEKVGEKVWRMPLNENYDKLINSKKADMQNINYVGGAGSTTAAQFLQRFILNKTPWAHLDIAGMAFSKYGGALNSGGATGYGVRLLNQLIEDNYE